MNGRSARVGDAIGNTAGGILITPGVPDSSDHKVNAGTSNPSLDTVPDTSHGCTVEDGPKCSPDPEGGAVDDGERDVVGSTDAASHANEARSDGVAEPDTYPRLPPR